MEVSTMNRDQIVAWFGESTVADAEALIGKSIEEFTTDDLQRAIDRLRAEIAAAEKEIDAIKALQGQVTVEP
jgi:hypothetical protein